MKEGPSTRLRLAGAGVLIATFLVGGLGGVAIERVRGARADSAEVRPQTRGDDRGSRDRGGRGGGDRNAEWQADFWRRSDYAKLGLDSAQIERINAVLIRQREQMDAYWNATRPGMDSIVERTRADLRTVLTPAQQAELDRIRAERRERWQRERSERGDTQSGRQRSSHDHAKHDGKAWP